MKNISLFFPPLMGRGTQDNGTTMKSLVYDSFEPISSKIDMELLWYTHNFECTGTLVAQNL
ncbi:hypothetical protein MTR_2g021960 [Medicago truncatula]|uniref:Uncharacterized protein n=1 Tax=Medicago truncatula TaxID=3880 RepID=A0A072V3Z2_MEDTR|nr:hypothetical protein MTR_2g021960 [Medicago truncatula]